MGIAVLLVLSVIWAVAIFTLVHLVRRFRAVEAASDRSVALLGQLATRPIEKRATT
jgi:hypothetical protein